MSGCLKLSTKPWGRRETECANLLGVGARNSERVSSTSLEDSVRAHSDLTVLLYDCRVKLRVSVYTANVRSQDMSNYGTIVDRSIVLYE